MGPLGGLMRKLVLWASCALLCAFPCVEVPGRAADLIAPPSLPDNPPPTAWIIDLGGFMVAEPTYDGSSHYTCGSKPWIDIRRAGDREWLSLPYDAVGHAVYETDNFRAGPAASITLQSRFHGQDIDLRLGSASVDLAGGGFAEYYPVAYIRTRAELLQGITGNTGLVANLSADYIWEALYRLDLHLRAAPPACQRPICLSYFDRVRQEDGDLDAVPGGGRASLCRARRTGKYDWTKQLYWLLDYSQLVGDAADSPDQHKRQRRAGHCRFWRQLQVRRRAIACYRYPSLLTSAQARLPAGMLVSTLKSNIAGARYGRFKRGDETNKTLKPKRKCEGRTPALGFLQVNGRVAAIFNGIYVLRIRPELQKITQKVAGKKYDDLPFTLFVFTISMVDFRLPAAFV